MGQKCEDDFDVSLKSELQIPLVSSLGRTESTYCPCLCGGSDSWGETVLIYCSQFFLSFSFLFINRFYFLEPFQFCRKIEQKCKEFPYWLHSPNLLTPSNFPYYKHFALVYWSANFFLYSYWKWPELNILEDNEESYYSVLSMKYGMKQLIYRPCLKWQGFQLSKTIYGGIFHTAECTMLINY